MRKLALVLPILLVLGIGVVLVAPSIIDWNAWREDVAARIEAATGRAVDIDGDLSLRILPRPTLAVDGVRLANAPGGSTHHMVRIAALRASLAWAPLLRGEIRVTSVDIVDPVILLERLPDGRANWMIDPPGSGGTGRQGRSVTMPVPALRDAPPAEPDGIGLTVALENVHLRNGRLVLRDARRDTESEWTITTLDLSADSLSGPYRVSGDVTASTTPSTPVLFDALVGSLTRTGTIPVDVQLLLPDSGATATVTGTLDAPLDHPTLRGDLRINGADLAAAEAILGPALAAMPGAGALPMRPFAVSARVVADARVVDLSDLRVDLDGAEGRGHARVAWTDTGTDASITLRLRALDVDAWLTDPPPAAAAPAETSDDAPWDETGAAWPPIRLPALPPGLSGRLTLSAEAMTWRGEGIRQAHLEATVDAGRLTVEQARANLPGGSTLSGRATLATQDGIPRVDGHLSATAGNLREVLAWLDLPVHRLPADRLRGFALEVDVAGTPVEARLSNLDLTVDTTRATGAVVLRGGPRLGIGANIHVESLALDAYRPAPPPSRTEPGDGSTPDASPPALPWLAALNTVDANARIRVDTLIVDGLPLSDITLDGSLLSGRLTVREARIGALAEARVTLSGGLSGFGGPPRFHGLAVGIEVDDPAHTARLLRIDPPLALRDLGPVTQTLLLDGPADALEVTGALRALGGSLDVNGSLQDILSPGASCDLAVDLRLPDATALARLMPRRASPSTPPDTAPVPLRVVARVAGKDRILTLGTLDLRAGDSRVHGAATLGWEGSRPHLVADLRAGHLRLPRPPALPLPDWMDADVTVGADTLVLASAPPLTGATMGLHWIDGVLTLDGLSADLAGGTLEGSGTLTAPAAARGPAWSLRLDARDLDLGRLLDATAPTPPDTATGGIGSATVALALQGRGMRAPIPLTDLTGEARLALHGLRAIPAGAAGSPLAVLLRPLAELDQAAAGLLGDAAPPDRATTLDGRARIDGGLLTVDALRLHHPLFRGTLTGTVDLGAGTMDAGGTLTVPEGPLRATVGPAIPVRVFGSLTDPAVRASFRRLRLDPGHLGGGRR
ncbi:AsmA family protein [Roseospira visakhapatnamensis]|uniref:AsmA domain-containing protein n=1 Tax=Roseospira visakhapatnamensis TaxID=390880 RepID=A0A7W6RAP0_9PROT|nr:hypothetical protein [Roseospira visakhapatnamensis]